MVFSSVFVTFPCGVLGQVLYLIVSIPDFAFLITLNAMLSFCALKKGLGSMRFLYLSLGGQRMLRSVNL